MARDRVAVHMPLHSVRPGPHRLAPVGVGQRAGPAGVRRFGAHDRRSRNEAVGHPPELRRDWLRDRPAGHYRSAHHARRAHGRTWRNDSPHYARRLPLDADVGRMARPGARRPAVDDHWSQGFDSRRDGNSRRPRCATGRTHARVPPRRAVSRRRRKERGRGACNGDRGRRSGRA